MEKAKVDKTVNYLDISHLLTLGVVLLEFIQKYCLNVEFSIASSAIFPHIDCLSVGVHKYLNYLLYHSIKYGRSRIATSQGPV